MCGIFGIATRNPHSIIEEEAIGAFQTLHHRGPDQSQFRVFQNENYALFVGTRRLVIVGGDEGIQPIVSKDKEWIVQLNGEIYNYKSLRRQCISMGVNLVNNSDSAVIAGLLEIMPIPNVIQQLRGMFALSIIHVPSQTISLYRDRMGVKPLYWYYDEKGETLIYSSEIRAIKRYTQRTLQISTLAVQNFLVHEYIPAPLTIYQDVYKLQPGHKLEWIFSTQNSQINSKPELTCWYAPPQITSDLFGSLIQWEKSLDFALNTATQLRCASKDVTTALLLSGGIDSALIAHYAQRHVKDIIGLHVSVEGKYFNEGKIAEKRAQDIGIQLQKIPLQTNQILPLSEEIFAHIDEPLADSSIIPTYLIMKEAKRRGIKVLLSGDGADESFGGYPTYQAHILNPFLKNIPPNIGFTPSHSPFSLSFILDRFQRGKKETWWKRHQLWMSAWKPEELIDLHPSFWSPIEHWVNPETREYKRTNVSNHLFLDQRLYLAEGVLTKVDRTSGAFGVEVRSPFLDQYIVDLAAQIPLKAKVWKNRKGILRKILKKYYPSMNEHTPKKGFGSPVSEILRSPDMSVFKSNASPVYEYVPFEFTNSCYLEHLHYQRDHRKKLWALYVLDQFLSKL